MWQPANTCPPNVDVLLAFGDGIIRLGQCYTKLARDSFKVVLDMGDAAATVYCPRDYLPTHWAPLPNPPLLEDHNADARESV